MIELGNPVLSFICEFTIDAVPLVARQPEFGRDS